MKKKLTLLLFGLLLAVGWTNAFAQQQATVSPAERLSLTVVDNQSVYDVAAQTNTYTNTLNFALGSGDNKITASMLNEGDNIITFHRLDNTGGDVECARVNLSAAYVNHKAYNLDFSSYTAPSSDQEITDLPAGWSTEDGNVILQTNGSGYIPNYVTLAFTVPSGFDNETVLLTVEIGNNNRNGYIGISQNTTESWSMCETMAGNRISHSYTVSSGDVIRLIGIMVSGSSYYGSDSPDITMIKLRNENKDITVTPTVSYYRDGNWTTPVALPNTSATTYTPRDVINLSGQLADEFSVEITTDNNHPDSYSYKADLDANVMFPTSDVGGDDFYAKVDFSGCTSTAAESATFTGPNNWEFFSARAYHPSGYDWFGYIVEGGSIIYTMPNTFTGSSVTVEVTSANDGDGAGHLVVDGIDYQFSSGETHSWNVTVGANGTIKFEPIEGVTYSIDIANIVIRSGNRSSLNAPRLSNNQTQSMNQNVDDSKVRVKDSKVLYSISKR